MVASWKFYFPKTSIFALHASLLGQIVVLRASNFRGATISQSSLTETLYCLLNSRVRFYHMVHRALVYYELRNSSIFLERQSFLVSLFCSFLSRTNFSIDCLVYPQCVNQMRFLKIFLSQNFFKNMSPLRKFCTKSISLLNDF